ncbi:DUF262 domain-containing protein [soil metagenome]
MENHVTGAPTVGIGRLLKEGGKFRIPQHQRDYSWTADQLEQLFQDVEEAQSSGQDEYFLGLMVFMPEGQRSFTILDGQQRLATTTIVLSAIRSWLNARGLDLDATQIQNDYIATRRLGGQSWEPSLILNETNNDAFHRHVVSESPLQDIQEELKSLSRYDSNRDLLEAAVYCRNRIEQIASSETNTDSGARLLYALAEYLQDSVKVVRLNVQSEVNAYTVFETLNDRGLDLSVLDLAKNHLFGRARNQTVLRDMQGRWTQMSANLANVRADDFLKTWWTSRYGRVQNPQLFSYFKERVSSKDAAIEVSRDLLYASEKYAALEVADDPLWAGYSEQVKAYIRNLKILSAQQVHAVLLSAVDRFTEKELQRLLRLLEVLIVRYQLIGGGRTGRLEISCARLAHRIYEGVCTNASEAATEIKDIFPDDDQFRESFKTKQERSTQKARYLLACLELQMRRAKMDNAFSEELHPSNSLTLEHILPKSPGEPWREILDKDPDFADEGTHRLGNLCLLTEVNKALGNPSCPLTGAGWRRLVKSRRSSTRSLVA